MKSDELARLVAEGGNLLGVFLCTGALRALRARGTPAEVNALLREAAAKYAPAFRGMRRLVRGAKDVEPALVRLEALARFGVDLDDAAQLADLRATLREILGNVGFELPLHEPRRGVVCPLHGTRCPAIDEPR